MLNRKKHIVIGPRRGSTPRYTEWPIVSCKVSFAFYRTAFSLGEINEGDQPPGCVNLKFKTVRYSHESRGNQTRKSHHQLLTTDPFPARKIVPHQQIRNCLCRKIKMCYWLQMGA